MEGPENNKIYLPELLQLLLRRWKLLLLAALMGALIFGAIRLAVSGVVLTDPERLSQAVEKNMQDTEKYEAEKLSLEQQVAALRSDIARRQSYLDNSVLMHLDPYDHCTGSLLVQIRTDYQIRPDMVYQNPDPTDSIVEAYGAAVRSAEFLSKLAEKADLSVVYTAELITVVTDPETNSLKVHFKHNDAILLEQLLELVAAHLDSLSESVEEAHSVQIVTMGIRRSMDMDLQAKQTAARAETEVLIKNLTDARTRLDNLEEPDLRAVTWAEGLCRAGMFALLGLPAGLVLFALVYCLYAVGCEQMLSARMLREAGFPVLTDAEPRRLVCDLQHRCPEDLLVAGKLPVDLESALKAAMPATALAADLLQGREALQALEACRGVVLMVPYGCRLEALRQQRILLEDYEKQLIGCVFLEE